MWKDKAAADEKFWFAQHMDAATKDDLNDFGWLYIHAKEEQEKLEDIICRKSGDTIPEGTFDDRTQSLN
jgi:hypothetical protein